MDRVEPQRVGVGQYGPGRTTVGGGGAKVDQL